MGRLKHSPLADDTRPVVACNTQFETVWRAFHADRCVGEAYKGAYPCCASPPCAQRGPPVARRAHREDEVTVYRVFDTLACTIVDRLTYALHVGSEQRNAEFVEDISKRLLM